MIKVLSKDIFNLNIRKIKYRDVLESENEYKSSVCLELCNIATGNICITNLCNQSRKPLSKQLMHLELFLKTFYSIGITNCNFKIYR